MQGLSGTSRNQQKQHSVNSRGASKQNRLFLRLKNSAQVKQINTTMCNKGFFISSVSVSGIEYTPQAFILVK